MKPGVSVIILALLCSVSVHLSVAQQLKMHETVVDTTMLRAVVVTIEAGKKTDVHTHPADFFYALTPCKLKVHYSDGKTEDYDIKTGEGGYGDPERPHWTENVGKKTAKFLLVELKEHPYKAGKTK